MFATLIENRGRSPLQTGGAALADAVERAIVLLLYAGLVARLLVFSAQNGRPANLLLLISEGLVVAFLVVRRPATLITTDWREWTVALLATLAPFLVQPSSAGGAVPPAFGALLLVSGMVIQVHAKLTLGRSFGCVPAHRGLKLSGPYQFVRHPMYAGYLLSHAAFFLMNPTAFNAAVYSVCYSVQIPRLLAEERLLARDPQYRAYQRAVPYRLIPKMF